MKNYIKNKIQQAKTSFKAHPVLFIFMNLMWLSVVGIFIRSLIARSWENAAICLLSLVLFTIPHFIESKFKLEIPLAFQIVIICFIYAAEILGEVSNFYTKFPGWDTILHTLNGFNCAAIGFSLTHILNHSEKANFKLSPFFVALVGFCFSMTIGVVWEFFEFGMDCIFHLDMQKDFIVNTIGTVTLDPTNTQTPLVITGITKTLIETSSGQTYVVDGGYLDIGIIDTMKDLLVNFVGAIVFCFAGYFYEKNDSKKNIAKSFIIKKKEQEVVSEQETVSSETVESNEEEKKRNEFVEEKENETRND